MEGAAGTALSEENDPANLALAASMKSHEIEAAGIPRSVPFDGMQSRRAEFIDERCHVPPEVIEYFQ